MSPYNSIIACLVATLSAVAHAAPLSVPSSTLTLLPRYDNSTSVIFSDTSGSPSLPASNMPSATILPIHTSLYHSKTGAIEFDSAGGSVIRDHTNNGDDISTLVTFFIDPAYASRTCEVVLDIGYQHTSGSRRADIYTSVAPAWTDTTSWPQGNLRNNPIGRVLISDLGGQATWEQTINSGPIFACADYADQYVAGELVPVGDDDFITWRTGSWFGEGAKIVVS